MEDQTPEPEAKRYRIPRASPRAQSTLIAASDSSSQCEQNDSGNRGEKVEKSHNQADRRASQPRCRSIKKLAESARRRLAQSDAAAIVVARKQAEVEEKLARSLQLERMC